jgi:hypothetical protein
MKRSSSNKKKFFFFLFVFFVVIFIFYLLKSFFNSLFFSKKERVNLVVFENGAQFYSLDKKGEINYFLSLPADIRVLVPGGYGSYRVGGLLKLIALEKNPELLRKTLSLTTGSFVDYYFYPTSDKIFYGFSKKKNILLPSIKQLFFYQSNANFFDRLYLIFYFFKTSSRKFIPLSFDYDQSTEKFLIKSFFDKHQGIFYQSNLRKESKNVQIIFYQNYPTALAIGNILEGEGIRVNDFSQGEENNNNCRIIEANKSHSLTAIQIANFFNCQLSVGETTPYDIIFQLNNSEKSWEIESKL